MNSEIIDLFRVLSTLTVLIVGGSFIAITDENYEKAKNTLRGVYRKVTQIVKRKR